MPKPLVLSARDVLKALKRAGFERVAQRGSHIRMKGTWAGQIRIVVVPNHPEIAVGPLLSIIRQAGMSREEFLGLR
jgi:predicted RNA binding protein YcfA (HicA-like mRNA interferase family)